MTKHSTFSDRLKLVRKAVNLTQKDFAKRIGVSAPTLSEIEKGKYKPGHDFFVNIAREFNVNLHFLLLAEGDMFQPKTKTEDGLVIKELIAEGNPDVLKFFKYFQRSPMVRYLIMGHFRGLLYKEREAIQEEYDAFDTPPGQE